MGYKSLFIPTIEVMAEEIGREALPAFIGVAEYSAVPLDLAEPFCQAVEAYQKALTPNTAVFGLQVEQMWKGIFQQFIGLAITSQASCMGAVLYMAAVLTTKALIQKAISQGDSVAEETREFQEAVTAVGWYTFVDQTLQRIAPDESGLKPAAVMVERYFRERSSATRL